MSWMLTCSVWMTSCASSPEPFFCPVGLAYDAQGQLDRTSYRVAQDCLKGLSARVRACYKDADR